MQEALAVVMGQSMDLQSFKLEGSDHLPQVCEEKSYVLSCLPSVSSPRNRALGGQRSPRPPPHPRCLEMGISEHQGSVFPPLNNARTLTAIY